MKQNVVRERVSDGEREREREREREGILFHVLLLVVGSGHSVGRTGQDSSRLYARVPCKDGFRRLHCGGYQTSESNSLTHEVLRFDSCVAGAFFPPNLNANG